MCRSCGSIIGAGQQNCAVCGTSVNSNPAPARQVDSETLRFARAVLERPYKFTIILLIANIFVFLLMWNSSGMTGAALWEFPNEVLWTYGAKLNSSISGQHQWWRLVTPMFLHVNLPHLLINMYSLWVVGPYVEKLYGSSKFVFFWVLTGIAGVLASFLTVRPNLAAGPGRFIFKDYDALSAGASGALFGLVGVLFVFGIKYRRELPEGFKRAFGTGLLPMIMLNLFIGYMGRGFIDNSAHLGGLICGGVLALAVDYRRPGENSGIATVWKVLRLISIAIVVVSFSQVVHHFRDPLPAVVVSENAPVRNEKTDRFVAYAKSMNEAQEAFYQVLKDRDATNVESAVQALKSGPVLDPKAGELSERLQALVIKAQALTTNLKDQPATVIKKARAEEHQLEVDFMAWSKEYNQWLKSNAKDYGMVEVTEAASPE